MGSLSSMYIKLDVLEKLAEVVKKKGEPGVEITISISEDTNDFGQNLSGFVKQSNEQREAKKPRFYVGNGKVFWTDGNISVAAKKEEKKKTTKTVADEEDPF